MEWMAAAFVVAGLSSMVSEPLSGDLSLSTTEVRRESSWAASSRAAGSKPRPIGMVQKAKVDAGPSNNGFYPISLN
jgi:hypothetical protein